jgi:hypothetical protein
MFVKEKMCHLTFTQFLRRFVGFSRGAIPYRISQNSNSYAIPIVGHHVYGCWLAGDVHHFELPEGAIHPIWKTDNKNVLGCGLVLEPDNKLAIFFTLNGQLLGVS